VDARRVAPRHVCAGETIWLSAQRLIIGAFVGRLQGAVRHVHRDSPIGSSRIGSGQDKRLLLGRQAAMSRARSVTSPGCAGHRLRCRAPRTGRSPPPGAATVRPAIEGRRHPSHSGPGLAVHQPSRPGRRVHTGAVTLLQLQSSRSERWLLTGEGSLSDQEGQADIKVWGYVAADSR
jgi:hypothetical protein